MALVNQQAVLNGKPPLGFINPALYTIGLGVDYGFDFHDIASEGNTLGATAGYDLSTGWGSPNGNALINALAGAQNPTFYISPSPTSVSVAQGASGTSTITTTHAGGFNSSIALSATGQPAGVTPGFSPTSFSAPGSGTSTLTLTVASTTTTGTYPITVTGTGGNLTLSTTVTLTVIAAGQVAVPNVVGETQADATTAITGAGLVLGTVTTASSSTVPLGDVISESPSAGTGVNPGSAVDIVVSSGPTPPAPAATPVFSPSAGTYSYPQNVNISDSTNGATIYYTTDGTTPTTSSPVYSGAILVSATQTLEAIATASGFSQSALAVASYTIGAPGSGEWTWMSGSNTFGGVGVYGTLGTPAAGNTPGFRDSASTWTDSGGHLWLFGGEGSAGGGRFNDLWEFNPSLGAHGEWAWMGGSNTTGSVGVYGTLGTPAAANVPGSRYGAMTWTDSSGHFWLFGGFGTDAGANQGFFNDLWEFNPSTGYWTWMSGTSTIGANGGQPGVYGTLGTAAAGNIPGGRSGSVSWTDSKGNLWLFGGNGLGAIGADGEGPLSDLWEFNPSLGAHGEWTWMGGSNATYSIAVYGTLGTPAAGNIPGGRSGAVSWTDSSGNFWLFGGDGLDSVGNIDNLNDLWEFNPTNNQWAWMSGSNTVDNPGVYGCDYAEFCPLSANVPGSRTAASGWKDATGNLWLFGGNGEDGIGHDGDLNDLWEFSPSTSLWTWMRGTRALVCNGPFCYAPAGVYGTLGTATPANFPEGRYNASAWTVSGGNFWLFGGYGADASDGSGELNDLWSFQPPGPAPTAAATPTFSLASGTYPTAQIVTISDATAGAAIYYSTNGYEPTTSSTLYSGAINVSATEVLQAIAVASGYANSQVAEATYTIQTSAPIQVAVPNVVGDTQAAATTAITGAGLVLGTVATQASSTVPSGDVISESPSAGTIVNSGSAVNLVVSSGVACTTANPNPNPNPESFAAVGDFNGDCKSDILWRNSSTEQVDIWLMNGTTFTSSGNPGTPTSDWVIQGAGDFNGDGKADILWRNSTTGEVYIWLMNGTTTASSGSLGNVSSDWSIAGVGDFNGDGKADILWQNTSGELYLWLMNGTSIAGGGIVGNPSPGWNVAGIGDFNGDGKADILWRNSTTGQVYVWLMNGTTIASMGSPGTPTSDWSIAGVGDFDGNGTSDILWRNSTTGEAYLWFMNGITFPSSGSLGFVTSDWSIQGVGDYDGSGRAGILWRNSTTEQVYVWLMNGTTITSPGSPGSPPAAWQIAP